MDARRNVALFACLSFASICAGCHELPPAPEPLGVMHSARVVTSSLHARFSVLPPPAGCAPVLAPVVFLPALGFTGDSFEAVARRVTACRARILVDYPGIGEGPTVDGEVRASEVVRAVDDVIASESARPVVLVGHSIGGAIALRLAVRDPERVAALVLIDAAVAPFPLSWWERLALHPATWTPLLRLFGPAYVVRHALPRLLGEQTKADEHDVEVLAEQLAHKARRQTLLDYYRVFLSPAELEASRRDLGRVHVPVTVIWGRRDDVVPSKVVTTILQALPPGVPRDVRWLPGGHLLPLERPEALARAIDEISGTLAAER
ncbi:MAG TPA: alpha/beta hydrolase [Polyangia bacterium]